MEGARLDGLRLRFGSFVLTAACPSNIPNLGHPQVL